MTKFSRVLTLAAALAVFGTASAETDNFDFNGQDPLAPTPLSLTSGSVTAGFSSPSDPGAFFVISPAGFLTFTDNVLVSPGTGPETLQINLSQPISAFSAEFATLGNNALTLTALSGGAGGTIVGTSSATGISQPIDPFDQSFPEGQISFSGTGFDTLLLSDDADPGFAVGSFSVTTAATGTSVPEPSTLVLMGLGLAVAAFARRRPRAS